MTKKPAHWPTKRFATSDEDNAIAIAQLILRQQSWRQHRAASASSSNFDCADLAILGQPESVRNLRRRDSFGVSTCLR